MPKVMKREEARSFFASGGNEKMYGKGRAGTASAGVSGKERNDNDAGNARAENPKGERPGYAHDYTFQKGGGANEMFGKGHAGKKTPGTSGKASQEG